MDIRQLRYFLQAFKDGSILQASEHIFISQQALSKTISSLEQEIGLPLFRRTSKGLVPTDVGLLLHDLAQPVVDSMDLLTEKTAAFVHSKNTHLILGVCSGLQTFLPAKELDIFTAEHPGISISVNEYPYDQCEALVENGTLTAALINGPPSSSDFTTINLIRRQRIALVQKDSYMTQKSLLKIEDFRDQKLAVNINNRCYENFLSLCHACGFEPRVHRVGDSSTMFSMCNDQGFTGISVDYLLLLSWPRYSNIVALPIDFNEFSYPVDLIINPTQYNRPVVRQLVDRICKSALSINEVVPQYPHLFP